MSKSPRKNAIHRVSFCLSTYLVSLPSIMSRLTAYRNEMNRVFTGGIPSGSAMARLCAGLILMFVLGACIAPSVVKVWSDEKHEVDSKKAHQYIFFVQSNNQINSRVAMDELVRLSTNKSIQGYLYTKSDPINPGNREYYKSKMKQDGYDYVVVMNLVDSAKVETTVAGGNPSSDKSFYGDYSFNIDPYAYNPSYERENKVFSIITTVYYVETGNKVWVCESKVYNPSSVEQAVKETSKEVVKKMKRNGFMN